MPDRRPNIILIMTDQQRFDTIAAHGYPHVDTPNLDRLAREGVSFSYNFCTAPVCMPSRASLFHGCYPHTTGIMKNGDRWEHTWVENLAAAGYYCVNIGKMHTKPYEVRAGFHERFVVENKDRLRLPGEFYDAWDLALLAQGLTKPLRPLYRQRPDYRDSLGAFAWELPEHTQSDMFVGGLAAWWLDEKPKPDQPLFLQVGFPGPHPPYDPVPRHLDPYLNRELPVPEVTEEELERQPAAQKELRHHHTQVDHDSIVWQHRPSRERLRRLWAHYLANVTMIDEQIGRLMDALERNGFLENAVVIFMSDHGECLGDYGHIQKWVMYDVATRVPLIVWAPGRWQGGRTVDALSQQMDVAPVIMELAGAPVPAWWEADSLMPALQGQADFAGREYVFAELPRDNIVTGCELTTMVRGRDWKLVHYLGCPDGELYDLRVDPGEHDNLWGRAEHAGRQRELLDVLRDWLLRSNLRTATRFAELR